MFDYGEQLRQHVGTRTSREIAYEELRAKSGALTTAEDIAELDKELVDWVARHRRQGHVVVDTHAVTREAYGFRATPFAADRVRLVAPTDVVVLYASPSEIIKRVSANSQGRRTVSAFEAGFRRRTFLQ